MLDDGIGDSSDDAIFHTCVFAGLHRTRRPDTSSQADLGTRIYTVGANCDGASASGSVRAGAGGGVCACASGGVRAGDLGGCTPRDIRAGDLGFPRATRAGDSARLGSRA